MEAKPKHLYQKLFNSVSLVLLILWMSLSHVDAQKTAALQLRFPILAGQTLLLRSTSGIQSSSITQTVQLNEKGEAFFTCLTYLDAAYFEVLFKGSDNSFEVYLPANDTLQLDWNDKHTLAQYRKDPLGRNQHINQLNALVDEELSKFYKSKRTKQDRNRLKAAADSVRLTLTTSKDAYWVNWAQLVLADVDEASGLIAKKKLLISLLPYLKPSPGNPAWQKVFTSYFDGDLLSRINGKQGIAYRTAISSMNYTALKQLYHSDSLLLDYSELADWLVLKGIYDLENIRGAKLEQSYELLQRMKEDTALSSEIQQELKRILQFMQPRIKGTDFPVLGCDDGHFWQQDKWMGMPVYLAILPDFSPNSELVIRQFAAFQTKYAKEIHFALLIPEADEKAISRLRLQFPGVFVTSMETCRAHLEAIFPALNRTNYILIDRDGKVYQNPAEGPETGVEAAFLNLIKR